MVFVGRIFDAVLDIIGTIGSCRPYSYFYTFKESAMTAIKNLLGQENFAKIEKIMNQVTHILADRNLLINWNKDKSL